MSDEIGCHPGFRQLVDLGSLVQLGHVCRTDPSFEPVEHRDDLRRAQRQIVPIQQDGVIDWEMAEVISQYLQLVILYLCVRGITSAVQALIAADADLHARSKGGFTPLLFAVRHNQPDTLRALVSAGADVDDQLPSGLSALALATLNAHYELGVWLLEQGADPNADDQGWTALHQLVWARRPNSLVVRLGVPFRARILDIPLTFADPLCPIVFAGNEPAAKRHPGCCCVQRTAATLLAAKPRLGERTVD